MDHNVLIRLMVQHAMLAIWVNTDMPSEFVARKCIDQFLKNHGASKEFIQETRKHLLMERNVDLKVRQMYLNLTGHQVPEHNRVGEW